MQRINFIGAESNFSDFYPVGCEFLRNCNIAIIPRVKNMSDVMSHDDVCQIGDGIFRDCMPAVRTPKEDRAYCWSRNTYWSPEEAQLNYLQCTHGTTAILLAL